MNAPQTMAEIVTQIEHAIDDVAQRIDAVPPARMLEPALAGGRSVKDLLAHLIWWDQWLLVTLPADPASAEPPIALPLAELIPPTNDWAEEMNARVHEHSKPRELSALLEEFAATRARLVRRVSRLSIEDLYDPEGMSAAIGQPVAPLVLGIVEHYEEHAHELAAVQWG